MSTSEHFDNMCLMRNAAKSIHQQVCALAAPAVSLGSIPESPEDVGSLQDRLQFAVRELARGNEIIDGLRATRDKMRVALISAQHDLITSEGLYACDNENGHSLFRLQHPSIKAVSDALSPEGNTP